MTKLFFNPGCALNLYKPAVEQRLLDLLHTHLGPVTRHAVCCHYETGLAAGATIINVCAGCDKRFGLRKGITTISLWEVLDKLENMPLPNYQALRLAVHDACPVRGKPQVHKAVRSLLGKMNIQIVEAERHSADSVCCGDTFYPALPLDEVHQKMRHRAQSMPCEEVAVYCVSCIKAMHIGGKKPRHLIDLLLGEPTQAQSCNLEEWHSELRVYMDAHSA